MTSLEFIWQAKSFTRQKYFLDTHVPLLESTFIQRRCNWFRWAQYSTSHTQWIKNARIEIRNWKIICVFNIQQHHLLRSHSSDSFVAHIFCLLIFIHAVRQRRSYSARKSSSKGIFIWRSCARSSGCFSHSFGVCYSSISFITCERVAFVMIMANFSVPIQKIRFALWDCHIYLLRFWCERKLLNP